MAYQRGKLSDKRAIICRLELGKSQAGGAAKEFSPQLVLVANSR
jgi:hypothetical protein